MNKTAFTRSHHLGGVARLLLLVGVCALAGDHARGAGDQPRSGPKQKDHKPPPHKGGPNPAGATSNEPNCVNGDKYCSVINNCIPNNQCCTDADCPPTIESIAATCNQTTHQCNITECVSRWYDIDRLYSTGCECSDNAFPTSCVQAYSLGTINIGSTFSPPIGDLPANNEENWFKVNYQWLPDNSFHPKIAITSTNGSKIVFDVYTGCPSDSPLACGDESGTAIERTTWETYNKQGDNSPTPALPTLYIKVHRTDAPTCDLYTLTVSNTN